jgi:hypothetical protein
MDFRGIMKRMQLAAMLCLPVLIFSNAAAAERIQRIGERKLGFSLVLPGEWKRVADPDGRTVSYYQESEIGAQQMTVTSIWADKELTLDERRQACKTLAEERRDAERQGFGASWPLGEMQMSEDRGSSAVAYEGGDRDAGTLTRSLILCSKWGAWAFVFGQKTHVVDAFRKRASALLGTAEVER